MPNFRLLNPNRYPVGTSKPNGTLFTINPNDFIILTAEEAKAMDEGIKSAGLTLTPIKDEPVKPKATPAPEPVPAPVAKAPAPVAKAPAPVAKAPAPVAKAKKEPEKPDYNAMVKKDLLPLAVKKGVVPKKAKLDDFTKSELVKLLEA